MELGARVESSVRRSAAVTDVRLVGSRLHGTATPLSDWDFAVEADDFEAVARELPDLVRELEPLAQQWDPLSETDRCYMLMLRGPTKVDLIFDLPHEPEPPWVVTPQTLPALDAHFWDWVLWIAGKELRGKRELVASELEKMSRHLLGPLGAPETPSSVEGAVSLYRDAVATQAERLGVTLPATLGEEVAGGLRRAGFAV